jgi:hypothetical protein
MNASNFMQPRKGKITSCLTKRFYIFDSGSLIPMCVFVNLISDIVQQELKKYFFRKAILDESLPNCSLIGQMPLNVIRHPWVGAQSFQITIFPP